jgi:hypothetical protein
MDGKVKISFIALSVLVGVLVIALALSCIAVPDKKKKVEKTKMTIVRKVF